jgi:hypothetical protein
MSMPTGIITIMLITELTFGQRFWPHPERGVWKRTFLSASLLRA